MTNILIIVIIIANNSNFDKNKYLIITKYALNSRNIH